MKELQPAKLLNDAPGAVDLETFLKEYASKDSGDGKVIQAALVKAIRDFDIDACVSRQTLHNINKGNEMKFSTFLKLIDALSLELDFKHRVN